MKIIISILFIIFALSCKPIQKDSQFIQIVNGNDRSVKGLHFIGPLINDKIYKDQENIYVKPGEQIYIKFMVINNTDNNITITDLKNIIYQMSYKNEPEHSSYREGGGRMKDFRIELNANLIIQPYEAKSVFLTRYPQIMYDGPDKMKIIYSFKIGFMSIFLNGTSNRLIKNYNFNICNK